MNKSEYYFQIFKYKCSDCGHYQVSVLNHVCNILQISVLNVHIYYPVCVLNPCMQYLVSVLTVQIHYQVSVLNTCAIFVSVLNVHIHYQVRVLNACV